MIQFSSHYFGQVPRLASRYCRYCTVLYYTVLYCTVLASRYCRIQEELGRTHQRVYGQSWGWERWDRRP